MLAMTQFQEFVVGKIFGAMAGRGGQQIRLSVVVNDENILNVDVPYNLYGNLIAAVFAAGAMARDMQRAQALSEEERHVNLADLVPLLPDAYDIARLDNQVGSRIIVIKLIRRDLSLFEFKFPAEEAELFAKRILEAIRFPSGQGRP